MPKFISGANRFLPSDTHFCFVYDAAALSANTMALLALSLKSSWPNGQGVGLLIPRLWVQVPLGMFSSRSLSTPRFVLVSLKSSLSFQKKLKMLVFFSCSQDKCRHQIRQRQTYLAAPPSYMRQNGIICPVGVSFSPVLLFFDTNIETNVCYEANFGLVALCWRHFWLLWFCTDILVGISAPNKKKLAPARPNSPHTPSRPLPPPPPPAPATHCNRANCARSDHEKST